MRRGRTFLVAGIVVAVFLGGVYVLRLRGEEVASPETGFGTFALSGDEPTELRLSSQWSVTVPVGGVPAAGARLTVTAVRTPSVLAGDRPAPLQAADFRLSTGQPTAPWTFTYRPAQSLASRTLYLLDDTGPAERTSIPRRSGPRNGTAAEPSHAFSWTTSASRNGGTDSPAARRT